MRLPASPLPLPPSPPAPTATCRAGPPAPAPLRRRVLASDLDRTLLTTAKRIHPANARAVRRALRAGLVFLPATGKSASGAFRAMGALGAHLRARGMTQGVFLNGLLVATNRGVIHEAFLAAPAVGVVVEYARMRGLVALFYRRDCVFVEERNPLTDVFIASHEPVPTEIGSFERLGTVNKALLLHPSGRVNQFRKELEGVLEGLAVITQAREDVLEVMPSGVTKATGLDLLLTELGFQSSDVVAVGDNENDVDMIRMAGLGIAVANAVPRLIAVADEVVAHCDDAAIAQVLKTFVL